jgi:disulfide bond formation protein DsbB
VTPLQKAKWLALLIPAILMAGALGSQYIGGLYPCEMCHWQRWPHEVAIVLALFALTVKLPGRAPILTALAALAIAVSGGIGVFHAGVEYGWWEGLTTCAQTAGSSGNIIADIMAAPVVRCDEPQWTLAGISLAGFNAIFSIGGALWVLALLRKGDHA